jgi:tetratricopeptide (TPR) repeat protein
MVSAGQTELAVEPTPEFNQKCMDVVQRWQAGDLPFKEAVALLTGYTRDAIDEGHAANQGRSEHIMGYIQHYRGNLNTSIRHYERALALYRKVGNRDRAAIIELNQGENYRFKGDFQRARRLYRAAYETASELNNIQVKTIAVVNEGLVLLVMNKHDSAQEAFEEGLELAGNWADRLDQRPGTLCEIHYGMAVIHMNEGDHEAAWKDALKSLAAAKESGQPFQLGFANRTLGEVVTMLKDAPDGDFSSDPDTYFRAAINAFQEINAEAELARTMFAQAKSLAIRGRRTTAARKLQQVMIIFTRLGMVDDAARAAEAQLAVL